MLETDPNETIQSAPQDSAPPEQQHQPARGEGDPDSLSVWLRRHSLAIELALLALIVLLAGGLRAYQLGLKSLWLDEIFFVSASQQGGLLGPYGALSVAHPPGYLLLMRLVSSISEAEWVLRLPAMLASMAGIVALWALGRRMFGPLVGLLAAFFLALSPMHLEFAQEAHSYALFATLSTLLLWALYRAAQRESGEKPVQRGRSIRFWLSTWLPFVLVAVVSLYIHYYALATVGLSLLIFPLFLLAASASSLPSLWRDPAKRRALLNLIVALAIVGLAFLPQLVSQLAPTVVVAGQRSVAVESGTLQPVFRLDLKSFADTLVAFVTYRPNWASDPLFFPAVTLLWLVGLVWLLARRTAAGIALSLWMFLPLPLIAWFAYRTGFSFSPRRLIFILPVFMLVVATGVTAIAGWGAAIVTRSRPGRRPLAMGLLIGVIVLAFVKGSYDPIQFYYRKPKQDWKTLAGILNTRPTDRDAIVLLPSATGPIQWYLTAEASVISENLVAELERLCEEHDAIYVAEATTRRPLDDADARYLAENTIQVPLKDLLLSYRNCQPQAWYGAGAEKLFPLAQHARLANPATRRAQQEFEALAAQFVQESVQSEQAAAQAASPTATPTELPPTPTPSPTPEPVGPMDARTLLATMVQEAPDDPLTPVRLGAFALQEGASPGEAGEYFQRAIELDSATWLAYGLWANSLANTGQISEALQIVDQGLAVTPDNLALQTMQARFQGAPATTASGDAYSEALEAGRSALRDRNWDDAVSAAQQAIALAPDRYEPQLVLGDANRGLNEFTQALQAYQRATDLAPYLSILHGRQAEMLARLGRASDASAAGLTAVAIDQSRWENWYALGRAYAVQATVADPLVDLASARLAESALLRSMELAPAANQTPARVLDDLRAAVARIQAAARPAASGAAEAPTASRAAAQQSLQSGNADQALAIYRALVEADPQDRESRMGVAAALAALQHNDEALAEYQQISADWPDFPFAYIRQGILLEEQGDLAGAITAYQAAVTIAPDNADAHFTLAYAYRRSGQLEQAVAAFEAGLALDPSRESARQALDELTVQLEVGEQP